MAAAVAEIAPEVPQLEPPKDTPFTTAELSKYDGTNEGLEIYVAIKGSIFDGEWRRGQSRAGGRSSC